MIDVSPQIAALPKHRGYSLLPARFNESFITFHYSGVIYKDRSRSAELNRIVAEAKYQLSHNYGSAANPAYPDGLLYDFVVLSDGTQVQTRARQQRLWHCGNRIGNTHSWAVHVMLGKGQDVTPAQRAGLFSLFDELRTRTNIPRNNVVSHCEWPRVDGMPVRSDTYRLLPNQSECPGSILHASVVVAYRKVSDVEVYRIRAGGGTLRSTPYRKDSNVVRSLKPGETVEITGTESGEKVLGSVVWMRTVAGGYIHSSAVVRVN